MRFRPVTKAHQVLETTRVFTPNGEPRAEILRAQPRFYLGVDLGQARDHAALVALQRLEILLPTRDHITWQQPAVTLIICRYAERIPLGMSYPAVSDYVVEQALRPPVSNNGQIVVDATGVGAPVVDLMRSHPSLKCRIVPVVITPGEFESETNGRWHVPKQDLMDGVRIAFEGGRIVLAKNMPGREDLIAELLELRPRRYSGKRDDMALALALAWWRASREAGRLG
jgi:hypothetical protein